MSFFELFESILLCLFLFAIGALVGRIVLECVFKIMEVRHYKKHYISVIREDARLPLRGCDGCSFYKPTLRQRRKVTIVGITTSYKPGWMR